MTPLIPKRSEQIFNHAVRHCTPCRSQEGVPCAIVPATPLTHDVLPVRSVLFRDWLADTFHSELDIFPAPAQLRSAVQMFEAKARRSEFPRQSLALRTSFRGHQFDPSAILLDLANPAGDVVEITPEGWQVVAGTQRHFRRSRAQQPLPAPIPDRSPEPPRTAFPPAASAWLLAALRPTGPYPILLLKGPAGCGKTTLARMLRALIDPATSDFCPLPRTDRDLMRLAWNNYVLAFDHVSDLPPAVATALCRLSSGAPFNFDQSNFANDSLAVRLQRPIILTIAADDDTLPHIANHAITIDLPPIASAQRRTERQIFTDFEATRPTGLASLCTGISLALGNLATTTLDSPSRFADASQWAIAASPALGISQEELRATLCPDQLTHEIAAFAHQNRHWEGTATELLETLKAAQIPDLPVSPNALTRRLHQSPLSTLGVNLDTWRSARTRNIRMTITARNIVTRSQCA